MKTGPFKPAPHIPQGYYIADDDSECIGHDLIMAGLYLKDIGNEYGDKLLDLGLDIKLSRELPSLEEQTIMARRNKKAKLVAFLDGEELEKHTDDVQNSMLLHSLGIPHG